MSGALVCVCSPQVARPFCASCCLLSSGAGACRLTRDCAGISGGPCVDPRKRHFHRRPSGRPAVRAARCRGSPRPGAGGRRRRAASLPHARGAGRLPVAGKDFPAKQLFPAGLGRMPAPDTVLIAAFPLHLHCDPSEFPAPAHRGELEPLSSSAPAGGSWSAPGSHPAIWCWLAGESRCSH